MDVFQVSVPNGIAIGTFDNTTVNTAKKLPEDWSPFSRQSAKVTFTFFLSARILFNFSI